MSIQFEPITGRYMHLDLFGRRHRIYVEEARAKITPEAIEAIISTPGFDYSAVPKGVMQYADFLYKIKRIKRRPDKWSDLFFPEIHDRPGS